MAGGKCREDWGGGMKPEVEEFVGVIFVLSNGGIAKYQ